METKVFLTEEHKENIFDAEANSEWLKIVKELALDKQEKLIAAPDKSPLPFPAMTNVERIIFSEIFDTHTEYHKFSNEAIPLACLSAIALCEKERYFHKIEIWYSEQYKDPLVIGAIFENEKDAKNDYSWGERTYYKIAQWGDKIKSLLELLPLWDKSERDKIEQQYNSHLETHNKQMKQFEFQIKAFK